MRFAVALAFVDTNQHAHFHERLCELTCEIRACDLDMPPAIYVPPPHPTKSSDVIFVSYCLVTMVKSYHTQNVRMIF
jgi:hypothetical protein